jgi:hypothetical protein
MSTSFDELRSQVTQIDTATTAPTGEDVYAGRQYFDTSTGRRYLYNGSAWFYVQYTSTSTSTTSISTSTTSSSSSSTSTTSSSISTSTTSSSSSSTSTTLY